MTSGADEVEVIGLIPMLVREYTASPDRGQQPSPQGRSLIQKAPAWERVAGSEEFHYCLQTDLLRWSSEARILSPDSPTQDGSPLLGRPLRVPPHHIYHLTKRMEQNPFWYCSSSLLGKEFSIWRAPACAGLGGIQEGL